MAQQRRLTSHIRTCDDNNLLALLIQQDVVGHIVLAHWQLSLNDRMATLFDIYHVAAVYDRTHIVVLFSCLGSTQQAVQKGYDVSILLYLWDKLLGSNDEFVEQALFQRENLIFSTQNLLLIFLQLLCDVSLCLCQCLLAHPFLWHLILIGVAHLQIVSEDVVIAYLQRGNARLLCFALLDLQQVVLATIGDMAQLVEFRAHTIADDTTFCYQLRRVVLYLTGYAVTQLLTETEAFPYPLDGVVICLQTSILDGFYGLQRHLHLYHLTR